MMNMLNSVREMFGMEPNSFYALFIPMTVAAIRNGLGTLVREYGEIRWIKFYRKEKNPFFNMWIVLLEMIYVIISAVLTILCFAILYICKFKIIIVSLCAIILSIFLAVIFARQILGVKYIKKNFIHMKKERYLVYSFLIIINVYFVLSIVYGTINNGYIPSVVYYIIASIFSVLIIIIETMELICFDNSYVVYKFSHLRIYTDQGAIIECEIRKIKRKWTMLIVDGEEKIIKVRYNNIFKVEYYGEPLYIMENLGEIIKKVILNHYKKGR